jgi:hypothetical protein
MRSWRDRPAPNPGLSCVPLSRTILVGGYLACLVAAAALLLPLLARSTTTHHVAPGGRGDGSRASPFGSIQVALDAAQPGDIVEIAPGTYAEALHTVRGGAPELPIIVRAAGASGRVVVTAARTVLSVGHPYIAVEGIVIDGQYAAADTVRVGSRATGFSLRRAEVRRSSKDCIDLAAPSGVVIEDTLIHRCLNAAGGRADAHGIVAGAVRNLTIRGCRIHTFSGDAFQVDPGRAPAGWDNVVVERSTLWLEPLAAAENGFAAGVVPGENAIDTKANASSPRARLVVRDVEARGFRRGLITNMAAFNLKENVDVLVDGVTVRDSEVAFRLRGPASGPGAWVRIQNAVVHDVDVAVRYEDHIENLRLFHTTFGANVRRPFRAAVSGRAGVSVRNLLLLGPSKPPEASDASNLAVSAAAFVDASGHDYRLAPGSPAIDAGRGVAGVDQDRDGVARPQGAAVDVGAYEYRERARR